MVSSWGVDGDDDDGGGGGGDGGDDGGGGGGIQNLVKVEGLGPIPFHVLVLVTHRWHRHLTYFLHF